MQSVTALTAKLSGAVMGSPHHPVDGVPRDVHLLRDCMHRRPFVPRRNDRFPEIPPNRPMMLERLIGDHLGVVDAEQRAPTPFARVR